MADEDYSRPYVGYRSAGRRPESQQDRRASADAPLSALRGYLAGTAGLPGDIEGLLRMMIPGVSNETALPGSEYFRKVLPLRSLQETPAGRVFTELGGVTGGAGLGTGARVAGRGAQALGRMTAEQIARGVEGGSPLFAAAAPAYVVKPKGGNWLAGSPSTFIDSLKTPVSPTLREDMARAGHPVDEKALADVQTYNTWVDKKLGNYVRNEMATPEDPLRAMAEKWSTEKPRRLIEADAKLDALNAKTRQLMQERGVPEEWLTQHHQDVLKAEKARDLIEAREALHTQGPGQYGRWEPEYLAGQRRKAGFPAEGMGQSEPAKAWEQIADESVGSNLAGAYMEPPVSELRLKLNPWLAKVPPETPVHNTRMTDDLGFEHLTDELLNALDPNSGLPAELLMKYSDLPKKTVPDVVERVADINAWRAAQKSETDLAKANNAAVVTHKEYPEQGLAWKQIKTPEADILDLRFEKTPEGVRAFDAEGNRLNSPAGYSVFANEEQARLQLQGERSSKALEEALKYEGDTMRHCVGGYCPDVTSGRSQIFSLRDERGRPHVTIEVKPGRGDPVSERFKDLEPEVVQQIRAQAEARDPSGKPWGPQGEFLPHDVADRHRDLMREVTLERFPEWADLKPADEIAQIKGLDNGPPDAKYLPAVQDFVKSGNWSEVRDLEHSGLRRTSDALNTMEIQKLQSLGIKDIPQWVSGEDLNKFSEALGSGLKYSPTGNIIGGYAAGGYVEYDPAQVDAVMQRTRAGFAEGGAVNAGNEPLAYDPTKISSIVAQLHEELNNGY